MVRQFPPISGFLKLLPDEDSTEASKSLPLDSLALMGATNLSSS